MVIIRLVKTNHICYYTNLFEIIFVDPLYALCVVTSHLTTYYFQITADQKRFESHCTAQYSVENTFSEEKHTVCYSLTENRQSRMSEAHLDEYDHYNFDQDKHVNMSGHSGKRKFYFLIF